MAFFIEVTKSIRRANDRGQFPLSLHETSASWRRCKLKRVWEKRLIVSAFLDGKPRLVRGWNRRSCSAGAALIRVSCNPDYDAISQTRGVSPETLLGCSVTGTGVGIRRSGDVGKRRFIAPDLATVTSESLLSSVEQCKQVGQEVDFE
jgi:hypothetical protein